MHALSTATVESTIGAAVPSLSVPIRRRELSALTGLRFFAALSVVCYHFIRLPLAPTPLESILSSGYTAVGLFFLLSGFILSYSYLAPSGEVSTSRRAFWTARFARIYPAYLFAFLLAAPFQIWGSLHVNTPPLAALKLSFGGVLVLSMMQAWTPWTVWYWNSPAWSLSAEVFFYFCFPLLARFIGRLRPRLCLPALAGVWLLGLLAPALLCVTTPVAAEPPLSLPQIVVEMNPLFRLPEFAAGMLLGRLYVSGFGLRPAFAPSLGFAALLALLTGLAFGSQLPRPLLANGLFLPASALLLLSVAPGTGLLARFLALPAIKTLGEASYGIYVFQIPVAQFFGLTPERFSPLRFTLFLLTLLAVSLVSLRLLEQPLRLRLKRSLSGSSLRTSLGQHSAAPLDPWLSRAESVRV